MAWVSIDPIWPYGGGERLNLFDGIWFWLMHLFGNWIILAGVGIVFFLLYRVVARSTYDRLLMSSYHFYSGYLPLAIFGVLMIATREAILQPFILVQNWMAGSYVWEQLIYWLSLTHIPSVLIYSVFILLMWRRFDSLVPAVYVGWFTIGVIELTFIPQHLVFFNTILGFNWYGPFVGLTLPLLLERKRFTYRRKGLVFLAAAFFMQYAIMALYPWSLSRFEATLNAFRLNPAQLPHPELLSWIFMEGQHVLKTLFVAAFSYLGFKK